MALFIAVIVLVILAVSFSLPRPNKPKLSISYITTINGNGHWRLKFGVTNVGNRTVVTYPSGLIEVLGRTNKLQVGATTLLSRLAPGQGHVIEAVLSEAQMASIDGPWRYTCLYAHDNVRTRINRGEYGPFLYKHIPRRFKGVPLTVTGTSDWIKEAK